MSDLSAPNKSSEDEELVLERFIYYRRLTRHQSPSKDFHDYYPQLVKVVQDTQDWGVCCYWVWWCYEFSEDLFNDLKKKCLQPISFERHFLMTLVKLKVERPEFDADLWMREAAHKTDSLLTGQDSAKYPRLSELEAQAKARNLSQIKVNVTAEDLPKSALHRIPKRDPQFKYGIPPIDWVQPEELSKLEEPLNIYFESTIHELEQALPPNRRVGSGKDCDHDRFAEKVKSMIGHKRLGAF